MCMHFFFITPSPCVRAAPHVTASGEAPRSGSGGSCSLGDLQNHPSATHLMSDLRGRQTATTDQATPTTSTGLSFSLLASRIMNAMIVTVRRRAVMTDHGIPCVHTQNNSRAMFYAQGQFVLILVCSSRVPPPATLLQHSQNRIVSAHSRVAWECSVSSGRLN